jgi:hypothetical protein
MKIKIILLFICLIYIISLLACSEKNKDRFINTYKDVLIAREVNPDTSIGNAKVKDILRRYSYTEKSFKNEFFEFAKNQKEFITMIDSARSLMNIELLQMEKKGIITRNSSTISADTLHKNKTSLQVKGDSLLKSLKKDE